MKKLLLGEFALAAMAVPFVAHGQISVLINVPPPPIRYEVRPRPPAPEFVWTDGYWMPVGRRYRWVAGRWERPPFPGAYWTHPHYDHFARGWDYHGGHWDHEDHEEHWNHGRGHAYGHDRDEDHGHGHHGD